MLTPRQIKNRVRDYVANLVSSASMVVVTPSGRRRPVTRDNFGNWTYYTDEVGTHRFFVGDREIYSEWCPSTGRHVIALVGVD